MVRININNPYGVYMHDTSDKGVFGDDNRFISSGCIRVQNVRDYVQWLLKDTPGWGRPQIDEAIRSGQQVNVKIAQPVPVYWVYVTAWAYPNGIVEFRDDIYQRDGFSNTATGSIGRPEPQNDRARPTASRKRAIAATIATTTKPSVARPAAAATRVTRSTPRPTIAEARTD